MVCKNRQRGGTHDCDVEVQAVHVKHDDPEDPLDHPKIRGSTKSVLKSLKCLLFNKSRKRGVGRGGWIEEDVRFDMVTFFFFAVTPWRRPFEHSVEQIRHRRVSVDPPTMGAGNPYKTYVTTVKNDDKWICESLE